MSSADAGISSDDILPTLGGGYVSPTAAYGSYDSSYSGDAYSSAPYTSGDYDSTYGGYSYFSAAFTSGSAAITSSFPSETGNVVRLIHRVCIPNIHIV